MEGELKAGRYLVEKKIGGGGQGVVYRAHDQRLDCSVAVKFIKPQYLNDPQFRQRLIVEARVAAAIQHAGIARSLDAVDNERECFVVSEFVEGVTLREELIGRKRFSLDQILKVGATVASALCKAHRKGVIHRDLKPENIMLSHENGDSLQVKILDFGLAKRTNHINAPPAASSIETQDGTLVTQEMAFVGTLGYMPPEQLPETPHAPVDGRADIFSLGAVLYEMATGENPFYVRGNEFESVKRTHDSEPTPLRQLNPDIDPEFEQIVQKCLRKKREARYQSAEELLQDLDKLKRTRSMPPVIVVPFIRSREVYIRIPRGWARGLLILTQLGYLAMYGAGLHYFFEAVRRLKELFDLPGLPLYYIACIAIGATLHIYLLSAVAWDYERSGWLFKCIFPGVLLFDLIWAASPLLLLHKLQGWFLLSGLLLAFLPFAQRDLVLAAYSPKGGRISSVTGQTPS